MPFRRWVAIVALVALILLGAAVAWTAWYDWTHPNVYPKDPTALLILPAVALPAILLVLYLRRPYDARGVPRDAMAVRGKAKLPRTLGVVPSKAFDDIIRDEAADLPESDKLDR